jgi:hypothetical protein
LLSPGTRQGTEILAGEHPQYGKKEVNLNDVTNRMIMAQDLEAGKPGMIEDKYSLNVFVI